MTLQSTRTDEFLQGIIKENENLMIIGNYNGENIGDNAILKVILHDLDHLNLGTIYVPSRFPKKTHDIWAEGLKNKVVPLSNYFPSPDIFRATLNSDVILVGGGTIFSKYAGKFVYILPFYLIFFWLLGKKFVFYSLGFEPSTPKIMKVAVLASMVVANKVSVRDTKSLATLDWVAKKRPIELINDPVKRILDYDTAEMQKMVDSKIQELRYKYDISNNYVLTAFNYVKEDEINSRLITKLALLIKEHIDQGQQIVMSSFYISEVLGQDDLGLNREIKKALVDARNVAIVEEVLDPFVVIELMKQAKFVIAERLHSMVLAHKSGVDFLAISYQTKCLAFLEQIDHGNYIELEELVGKGIE